MNIRFFIAFALIFLISMLRYPTLSFSAELWAEQGSNFLFHALSDDIWTNLFTPDAGYLVWLQRLISLIAVKYFPLEYFPHITSLAGIALITISLSLFNGNHFRFAIPNDNLRLSITLVFGVLIAAHYENFTFVNFSYFGFYFITLLLFIPKENLKPFYYVSASLLSSLFMISKFHFLLFLPFITFFITFHRKSFWINFNFYLPSFITAFIQLISVFINLKSDPFVQNNTAASNFSDLLMVPIKGLYWWLRSFLTFSPLLINLLLILLLIWALYKMYRQKKFGNDVLIFIVTLNLVALFYAIVSSLNKATPELHLIKVYSFSFSRQFFITFNFVSLSLLVLLQHLNLSKIKQFMVTSIFILLLTIVSFKKSHDIYSGVKLKQAGLSSWHDYVLLLNREAFCIPLNPTPQFMLAKNCIRTDAIDYADWVLINNPQNYSVNILHIDGTISNAIAMTDQARDQRLYQLSKKSNQSIFQSIFFEQAPFHKVQVLQYYQNTIRTNL